MSAKPKPPAEERQSDDFSEEAYMRRVGLHKPGQATVEQIICRIEAPNLRKAAMHAVRDLAKALAESEPDISDLATLLAEEKQDEGGEGDVKVNLGFKMVWNLDRSSIATALTWTRKHKVEAEHRLGDDNQAELPLGEEE